MINCAMGRRNAQKRDVAQQRPTPAKDDMIDREKTNVRDVARIPYPFAFGIWGRWVPLQTQKSLEKRDGTSRRIAKPTDPDFPS